VQALFLRQRGGDTLDSGVSVKFNIYNIVLSHELVRFWITNSYIIYF